MKKIFLLFFLSLFSIITHANYFYYWTDNYEAYPDQTGINLYTNIKSSDTTKVTFIIEDKIVAEHVDILEEDITTFPLFISNKHLKDKNNVTVCTLKETSNVSFNQQVCLNIKLIR